ncbi:MAG: tetratricopeptide repeat protein, partial [Anaerolineae bacterium]|nr:tetratricopeptide repeat protein [Anaerolineae bacterium]
MTKIFIGSTSKDLENYRKAAIDVCLSLDLQPIAMEHFPAMGKGATAGSKSKVDEADLYIGIFALRYGYIEDGYDKSVTEIEFDYAGERGLDRLCFLVDPKHPWPTEHIDYKNKDKLDAFKEKINKLIRKEFTTVEDFQAKLTQTLVEWQRQLLPRSSADSAVLVTEAASIPGKTDKFRGRKKLIKEIQKALNKDKQVLMQGFGGMGKTALAAECAADHLPLLWVKAASTDALFEALARPFNAHAAIASQTGEAKIHLMRQILAGSGVQLLLVDDVWDGKALNALSEALPPDIKLLVTSRQSYPLNRLISVRELDEKEALDVLSVYAGKKHQDAADLCKFLGYHAFALEIAGAMLKVDNLTPAALLRQISANPVDHLTMPLDFAKAGRENIKALLDASVEKLDDTTRQVFLAFGALFAPGATPEMLALYLSAEPVVMAKALTELTRRSLAERQPATDEGVEFYRIHDLAHSYARAQATDEQRRRALDACLSYTERYDEPGLPNFAALRPELDTFMGAAAYAMQREEWAKAEDFASNLYAGSDSKGRFLFYQGFYTQAVTLLNQAALAAEKQGNRQNQGAHLGNLGNAYDSLGDYPRAIAFHQQALAIAREIGDKRGEGNRLGNLGIAYFSLGDYPKAIEYLEQALT